MKVDYAKQTLDNPNPVARFAHRKRYAYSLRTVMEALKPNGVVLDYGCGKGHFLALLAENRPDAVLLGFDPESGHSSKGYSIVNATNELEDGSVDLFLSFEVLEHLQDHERRQLYLEALRLLRPDGRVIVSVPVIGGPPLLVKEINRMVLFRRASDYSPWELLKASLFGIPASRPADVRGSHKGFDFRVVESELRAAFEVHSKTFSPFPALPWYLNSQAFFFCSKLWQAET